MRHLMTLTGRITLLAGLVLAAATCSSDQSTTPSGSHPGEVSVSPTFASNGAIAALPVTQEVLTVVRAPAETLVSQTRAATLQGELLTMTVPVDLAAVSESLVVTLELRNEATPLLRGVDTLNVTSGVTGVELPIAETYVGPGANIAHLTVTTPDTFLVAGDSISYLLTATDGAGQPVPAAFFHWSTSTVAVSIRQDGYVTGPNLRQTIQVIGQVPNGTQDSATLRLYPAPSQVLVQSGNVQQGVAGDTLTAPLVVTVLALDNLPVRGAKVTFAPPAGTGSVVTPVAFTDSLGHASTRAVLGTAAGVQFFTASIAGGAQALFGETGNSAAPATLAIFGGNGQTGTALGALPQPLSVRVTDAFGNPVPAVKVAWLRIAGTGTLAADTTVTQANGVAPVTFTLGAPGLDSVRATLVATSGTIDFAATSVPGAPATVLRALGDSQTTFVDSTVAIAPRVKVVDANGFAVPGAAVTFAVTQGGGAVTGATPTTDASGLATVGSWRLGSVPATNKLTAQVTGATPAVFTAFGQAPTPVVHLSLPNTSVVPVGGTAILQALLSTPAGPGGVSVTVTSGAAGVISVGVSPLVIAAGDSVALFTLHGVSIGSADLVATAAGYDPDTLTTDALDNAISVADSIIVPLGQTAPLAVKLSHPAPAGGVTVSLVSQAPTKLAPTAPFVFIAAGDSTATATISGVGVGTAVIVAVNPAYLPDSVQGRTSASFNITLAADTVFAPKGGPLTTELRAGGILTSAPAGGVPFTLVSRNPACAAARTPTIAAGQKTVVDSAVYGGTAALPCETFLVATAPGIDPDSVKVRFTQPHLAFNTTFTAGHHFITAGSGLQDSARVDLGLGLNGQIHPALTLTLRTLETGIGALQPDAVTPGVDSIQVPVANGVAKALFWFAGIEGVVRDTVKVEASIPGFAPDTLFLIVRTPNILTTPNLPSQITSISRPKPVILGLAVSDISVFRFQGSRAGQPAPSTYVRSSHPQVIRIVNADTTGDSLLVTWAAGSPTTPATVAAGGVAMQAVDTGTSLVDASSPTFINSSGSVTVVRPFFQSSHLGQGVGSGLQHQNGRFFGLNDVANGTTVVTIKSSEPTIMKVAANDSTPGDDSVVVTVPNGAGFVDFYLQGMEGQVGQSIITISSPGYATFTDTVSVVQPALGFVFPLPPATISAGAASVKLTAGLGVPNAGQTDLLEQQTLRAGGPGPLTVTFANGTTGVAQLVNGGATGDTLTATIARPFGSTFLTNLLFDPLAPGSTTLTVTAPGVIILPTATKTVAVTP